MARDLSQLSHLLFRLESKLAEHFQLRDMEVPTSEDRLRWSLSRFLYSAAKKHSPARLVFVFRPQPIAYVHIGRTLAPGLSSCSTVSTSYWARRRLLIPCTGCLPNSSRGSGSYYPQQNMLSILRVELCPQMDLDFIGRGRSSNVGTVHPCEWNL